MLDLKKNRLDYGTLLMPPAKHTLTHAVTTTYSLDLYTLLAIPVALFYSKILDGNFEQDRYDVLDAIEKTAGILNIYCQKGKMKVPGKFNYLFAYLEDSITEIIPPNHVSSFHPKIWILRFKKAQEIKYRVIVLSRNLTFDRSWDLAFYVNGSLSKQSYRSNQPIVDFASHLFKKKRIKGAATLLDEIPKVKFEDIDGFDRLNFYPIGFDNFQTYKNPLEQSEFEKLLIISPFVDRTTLKKLHQNSPAEKILISREEELQKIPAKLFKGYEPYFLTRRVVEGEALEDFDEAGFEPQKQQLHAKLFIGEKGGSYHWFLGSANCTDPAFTRNTEFMIELISKNPENSPDHIKNILINPEDDTPIFEEYDPEDFPEGGESENIRQELRKLEYQLINSVFRGKVEQRKSTLNYDLTVTVNLEKKQWDKQITVKIAPLNFDTNTQPIRQNCKNDLLFQNLSETELSKFLVVSISYKGEADTSFLIKMQVKLPEGRKGKILKSLISSRDNFFKYLNFLLLENPYLEDNTLDLGGKNNGNDNGNVVRDSNADLPIFEHLLIAASRNPQKLKAVDRLVQRLKDDDQDDTAKIVPDEFYDFWNVFKEVAGIK